MSPAPQPSVSDWLFVAALGVIWGASFMAVSVALDGQGPIWVAAARIALAALALCLLAQLVGPGLPRLAGPQGARIWLFAAGMGVFSNALPFTLLAWGQQHVASGFAGITMAAVPLFTLGLAHFLVAGERLGGARVAGFLMGLAGVAVLIGPAALETRGVAAEGAARIACLMAAASYAVGSIVTRRCPPVALMSLSAAALLVAALAMVPLALLLEGVPRLQMPLRSWGAVLYLGIGPTALATLILVRVIRSAGPGFLSQVNYQVPVWSVIFGVMILSEDLPPQFLFALALILGGLALSRAGPWRRRP